MSGSAAWGDVQRACEAMTGQASTEVRADLALASALTAAGRIKDLRAELDAWERLLFVLPTTGPGTTAEDAVAKFRGALARAIAGARDQDVRNDDLQREITAAHAQVKAILALVRAERAVQALGIII